MKAVVRTACGSPDVLQLREVEKPTPRDNEVLVQVHAASVNASDWHMLRGTPFLLRLAWGLLKPKHKIPGSDMAGGLKRLAGKRNTFSQAMRYSGTCLSVVLALLQSMHLFLKRH